MFKNALRPLIRGYATTVTGYGREVEGFVGAVGNTPLVSDELHLDMSRAITENLVDRLFMSTMKDGLVLIPDPSEPIIRGIGQQHPRQS